MANTEKSSPSKLFFSSTKFAPGIHHADVDFNAGNKSAYRPFKMKFSGENPVQGNFPQSFKNSGPIMDINGSNPGGVNLKTGGLGGLMQDNSKPSTSQSPGGPPFLGAVGGALKGAIGKDDD